MGFRLASQQTPVIVLGSGLTALGVVRILGRARIPAYLVTTTGDLAARSRWGRRIESSIPETEDAHALGAFLGILPVESAVLMACTDTWSAAVAALDPAIAARFPASISSLDTLRLFLDKRRFAALLEELEIPHPQTRPVRGEGDLALLDSAGDRRFFLKPCNSQKFSERFRVKAFPVQTRAEAEVRLQELEAAELEAVLQEYIPGSPSMHYFVDGFVDRSGSFLARFARRRLRMYPPDFGNSSAMVSVSLEEAAGAVESLERMLPTVGYRGIFSAEFKLDTRDGQFKILEVNTRPWWYVEYAALCGVDVCTLAYRDALGLPQHPLPPYPVGRRYVFPTQDLRALWCGWRHREIGAASLVGQSLATLEALRRWDDPAPALARGVELFRRAARRAR